MTAKLCFVVGVVMLSCAAHAEPGPGAEAAGVVALSTFAEAAVAGEIPALLGAEAAEPPSVGGSPATREIKFDTEETPVCELELFGREDTAKDGPVETGKAIAFNELVFQAITDGAQKFENKKAWEEKFIYKLFEVDQEVTSSGDKPKPKRPLVDEVHFLAAFSETGTFGSVGTANDDLKLLKLLFERLWEQGRKLVTDRDRPEQTRVLHYDCTKSFFPTESFFPVDVSDWEKFLARDFPSMDAQCEDKHGEYINDQHSWHDRNNHGGIPCYSTYESTGAAPRKKGQWRLDQARQEDLAAREAASAASAGFK